MVMKLSNLNQAACLPPSLANMTSQQDPLPPTSFSYNKTPQYKTTNNEFQVNTYHKDLFNMLSQSFLLFSNQAQALLLP